ncbi:hypothetical protein CYMTET_33126 [Cymbomonas tetramitiformis]|uniref:Protein kinase domain-containing protein n=1 Tax=Cymbomonas tetramitiformis TaxID=36881 RepID=A0AAE0FDN8_9CHLO|nr:hypothetical protein CYMTET_33126 [Cymbomonas tetramitiformis]|eukprot:gene11667-biopygen11977
MCMMTLVWQAAPEYVVPLQHFGILERKGHRPVPFLVFMDHGICMHDFLHLLTSPIIMACKRELCLRLHSGLRALHASGVVQRNLRASNIVLSPSRPSSLVLVDFGLARREHREGLPEDGYLRRRWVKGHSHEPKGTVFAPEYSNAGPTPASDMWSMASLLVRIILIRGSKDGLHGIPDKDTSTWHPQAQEQNSPGFPKTAAPCFDGLRARATGKTAVFCRSRYSL